MQFWPGILGYVKMILKDLKACQMPEPAIYGRGAQAKPSLGLCPVSLEPDPSLVFT